MMQKSELVPQLADAYKRLYDLGYLGNCRLADMFFPDTAMRRKGKAWQLQALLLKAIEELNAAPNSPVFSRGWRQYRLMSMHYLDGSDPKTIADQLNISRRHYYREHDFAIDIIAASLLKRLTDSSERVEFDTPSIQSTQQQGLQTSDRSTLLRDEIARSSQAIQRTQLSESIQSVMRILHDQLNMLNVRVEIDLNNSPLLSVDRGLLRHILICATQSLTISGDAITLRFTAQVANPQDQFVRLQVAVERNESMQQTDFAITEVQRAAIQEITELSNVRVEFVAAGLVFTLPLAPRHTVLIIDDNPDLAELFKSWLSQHGYSGVVSHTAQAGIHLAKELNPYAITLDLMMPDQDGWDTLQILSTQPETNHIPVIVCSVLRQEDLALSLGAWAFLLKPVTKHDLLLRLEELQAKHPLPSGSIEPRYQV